MQSVARVEHPDLYEQEREIWIVHVLMLASILVNRLAVSLRRCEFAEHYLIRICEAFLNELRLKMHKPPSGKSLFTEAAKSESGMPDDVLHLLRESDVQLTRGESE